MFQKFIDLINDPILDWKSDFDVHDTKMRITAKRTGNHIFGTSFENSDNIMGVSNITELGIDEPLAWNGHIALKDFENISESLRNDKGITPIITLMTNPISKETFIYKDIANPDTRTFRNVKVTHLNYTENPFCPEDAIERLESLKLRNYERYRVNGLGEWGVIEADNPYFINKGKIRIHPVQWNPDALTIFGTDFNLDIMASGTLQIDPPNKRFFIVDEFEPCKGVHHRVESIKMSPYYDPTKLWLYNLTGDFNGANRNQIDGQLSCYNYMESNLGFRPLQTKISKNITHYESRLLCALIMAEWEFVVDPKAKRTIEDIRATNATPDGKIDKKKRDPHYADGVVRYPIQNYCK